MKLPDFLFADPIGFYAPGLAAWMMRHQQLAEKMNVALMTGEKQLSISDFVNARRPYAVDGNGIATIHANEALSRTATNVDKLFGDTHYNDLIEELDQATSDDQVRGILLDVSSPGGSAIGAPEAAQAVLDARQEKPIVAYVETVGASAAYYFMSAANAIVVSPSSVVGSIGTIATFFNLAGMLQRFGVDVKIITPAAADLKASGNPFREMTRAEEDFLQQRIESINASFTNWVSQNRTAVGADAMRGNYFSGTDAVSNGLVDQTGSRQDALDALEALIQYSSR